MRPPHIPHRATAALLCTVLVASVTACSASADELETIAAQVSAVTDVAVGEAKSGDGQAVTVTTASTVTVEQVLEVFSSLSGEVGEDGTVTVVVDSPSRAQLSAAGGTTPPRGAAEALLVARDDPDAEAFVARAPKASAVDFALRDAAFATLVERGDALVAAKAFDTVEVRSGKRRYVVAPKDDAALLAARAGLVSEIDADFDLLEATVTGSDALALVVAPGSVQAVKVFLAQEADSRHGVVTVST